VTLFAVAGQLNGISVGDFNGDGRLDVAVAIGTFNAANGRVAVLRGNGDGTLQLPVYYTVAIPANSIAVGDFNNDNRLRHRSDRKQQR
jgi:VCBS repeat protein